MLDPGDDPGNLDPSGALLGAHLGFNIQRDNWVYGWVADISLAGIEDSQSSLSEPVANQSDLSIDGLASLRGRMGIARKDVMIFATAGLGYVAADYTMRDPDGAVSEGTVDLSGFGPVFGGGVELQLKGDTRLFAEVLRFDPDVRADTSTLTSDSNPEDFVEFDMATILQIGLSFDF